MYVHDLVIEKGVRKAHQDKDEITNKNPQSRLWRINALQ